LTITGRTNNAPALRLYTAAGFQPVSGLEVLGLALTPGSLQAG
jgi:hypothetical protein